MTMNRGAGLAGRCLVGGAVAVARASRRAAERSALVLAAVALVAGCAGESATGPYRPATGAARDTASATALSRRAADLIDSDPAAAEELLRRALTADLFYGPAHNNLGVVYLGRGDLYEAASEFQWARKLMPSEADPRLNLALTLELAGRTTDAIAEYAMALEDHPDHLPLMQGLASLQIWSGRPDERTPALLSEIALRGDAGWRSWARFELARGADSSR